MEGSGLRAIGNSAVRQAVLCGLRVHGYVHIYIYILHCAVYTIYISILYTVSPKVQKASVECAMYIICAHWHIKVLAYVVIIEIWNKMQALFSSCASIMMLTSFGKFGVASQHHPRPGPTGSPALQLLSSQSMSKASNEDTLFVYMLNLWVTSNGLQMPWVASCWDFADTHAHTMWNAQTTSTHFETDVKHWYFVHPFWYLQAEQANHQAPGKFAQTFSRFQSQKRLVHRAWNRKKHVVMIVRRHRRTAFSVCVWGCASCASLFAWFGICYFPHSLRVTCSISNSKHDVFFFCKFYEASCFFFKFYEARFI